VSPRAHNPVLTIKAQRSLEAARLHTTHACMGSTFMPTASNAATASAATPPDASYFSFVLLLAVLHLRLDMRVKL
jgi:hypothetical protein